MKYFFNTFLFLFFVFGIRILCISQIKLIYPQNNITINKTKILFHWDAAQNNISDTCEILISDQTNFSNIIFQTKSIKDTATIILPTNKQFYWKVIKNNTIHSSINEFKLINPLTLDSLVLWLNTDSISLPIGSSISTWTDLSLKHNDLIQNISSNQPSVSLSNNYLNNVKTINFDGIDDYYKVSIPNLNQPLNYFLLVRNSTFSSADIFDGLNPYSNLFRLATGFYCYFAGTGYICSTVLNNDLKFKLLNIEANTSNTKIYANGILNSIGNPGSNNPLGLTLGGNAALSGFTNLDIAEIMIIKKTISDSLRIVISNYIMNKNTPPVSLGSNIYSEKKFCDTILNAGSSFLSYQWSTGATTQTISVNQSGKYWISATNIYGEISSDTIRVNFPSYNKPSQNSICSNNTLQWNTQLPKSDFTFQWQDNSIDSVFNINQSGNYYVKITDSFGCSITSDTAYITIDNFSSTASLGPDLSLCAGNSISLVSGVTPSLTYTWSTGSNNDSITITNTGQYSVIVTNTNSCVAKDTINVSITGLAPVANFTSSIGCKNNAVSFTDLSVPPSGNTINSYDWNFGDLSSGSANTSTLSNPFHTFSDTGNYSITLKVITNIGCEQSVTKTIHIAPKPIVNFTVGLSCQNDSTSFFGSITNPGGYTTSSLKWNFGDPSSGGANNSTLISPKHLFSNSTNYTIKLVATNNAGCKDSLTNIIAVKGQVKADFTYSSACTNTATLFQDNSIVPAPNSSNIRSWNFGTSTASGLTVSKSYTNSGVYSVTLSVTGNNGCNSSISKVITIFNPPVTSFSIPTFCAKDTITINNSSIAQSGIISSYNWKLNNSSFSSIQNPTLSISSAGNYSVSLTTTNNFGCKDSLTKTIMVNPLPIVDFTTNPASYYYINEPVAFIPSINNANFYFWNISPSPTTTVQSPIVTFTNQGIYNAFLLLQDQQGCINSINKNLTVAKRFLDIGTLNVNSSKDADGFVSVQTDIINYGTIPAYTIDLNYQVSDGGNIKETWTGTLTPNSYFTYTFNSKISTQPHSSNHITCVDARKVNGINDENTDNNKMCSALNTNELSVSNPIPNPTSSDIVLPVILNKDLTFSITIYNSTGQIIYEEPSQNGITGLNLITIPSSNYARGCYIIKTVIDDKIFIKKFIKIGNE